jgi:hypothetical protein
VIDEEGNPIQGAKIVVGDRTKKVKTFEDGDFWRLVSKGTYLVKARKRGYKNSRKIIKVYGNVSTFVNFTLVKKGKPAKPVDLTTVLYEAGKNLSFHANKFKTKRLRLSVESRAQSARPSFVLRLFFLVLCFVIADGHQ